MAIQWNWNVLTGVLLLILRPKYCSRWSDWNKISISYKARLQIAQVLTIQSLHAGNIPSIFKTFQSLPLTFKSMISIQEEILMFCCRQHWLQKCPKMRKVYCWQYKSQSVLAAETSKILQTWIFVLQQRYIFRLEQEFHQHCKIVNFHVKSPRFFES